MMRILVDMDGIVVDLLSEWLRTWNLISGDSLTPDKVSRWNVAKCGTPYDPEKFFAIIECPGFFDYLPAIPGAIAGVTRLHKAGHEIRFATAPPCSDAARAKIEWVKRHFSHLEYDQRHVIFSHDKHWIDADAIIDDRPKTITGWADMGRIVATIEYPYNGAEASDERVFTAGIYTDPEAAWAKIVEHFEDLSVSS